MEFTILMPCLNEEETLEKCIKKAIYSIEGNHLEAEVLIADNGSTDKSVEIAEKNGARVIHVKEKGYGSALNAGINDAKGKYIIMGDSDDSYDFTNIQPFINKLREGNDLVMGNRFRGGIKKKAMPFLHRYLGNPVLSFIGRLFFKIPVFDFHCGLRGFNKQSIINLNLCTTGMEFASEMVVKSAMSNLKIVEVPTTLHPDGRTKPPHLRTWRDGWRHLRFLLLYSPKWLFLYPGLLLVLLGVIISAILMEGPVQINNITLDVHTLLYASGMVIIGFQTVFFYLFSTIFSTKIGLQNKEIWLIKFERLFSLEKTIGFGIIMILIGLAFSLKSIIYWDKTSFGNLNPSQVFRIVIPAVSFLILGTQLIFNSFFMSILCLNLILPFIKPPGLFIKCRSLPL